ncbi:hypothetical protein RintRC_7243 [Richelia intracellularis]|nr:hypothetical protein RintRC_7243 [Richelia intracellularis]
MFGTLMADFHKQWQIDALLYPNKLQLPLAQKMFYLNIRHNNLQNLVFGFSKTHFFLLPLCF